MILVIDNYDSFVYNLVQYLGELGAGPVVYRNDRITVDEIRRLEPAAIVVSPGPGRPRDAGISVELIRRMAGRVPILGVCLGHQAIAEAFGARIERAGEIVHGKTSHIHHDGRALFNGMASPLIATRYHSLVVARESVPDCLEISAWTDRGLVMGLRHGSLPIEGVQFHPESIMTVEGKRLLANFLMTVQHAGAASCAQVR